jgi:signal transduction histidine kinase
VKSDIERDAMPHSRRPANPLDDAAATVWLVDDSPLQAEIGRRGLARHAVETFRDAATLLERLACDESPDIIVLDWHMPYISGLDACRHIRESRNGAELPIIVVTASDRHADLTEGLAAGANDFLRKPFDVAELNARVSALVRTKRLYERMTQAESALREEANFREQFLAILAHDLRQPLNVFGLGSDIVASPTTTHEGRAGVSARMSRAASRMQRMIEDLLDFSRSRPAAGMPIRRRTTNLETVARDVVDEIRIAHSGRTVGVAVEGACEGSWDPDRLAQVVSNLVENALANSPPDSAVELTLVARGGRIELVVENEGATIPPDQLPTIFDAFRHRASAKAQGGLGLGLYIVAQIVRAHGGTAAARSADGRTRFG